ncbi:MAG: hypothetical protein ACI4F5_07760 [Acutalibacteraceae bacterium]
MKKSFLRIAAVFLTILTVAGVLYGCGGTKTPNEGIDTITDKNGITYLAIVDDNDGHTLAGVTDEKGNLYAAETDASGAVLTDGNLYSVSYTGELPTNDTTAVSINESQNTDYNYANKDVVTESTKNNSQTPSDTISTSGTKNESQTPSDTSSTSETVNKAPAESTTEPKEVYLAEKYKKLFESQTYYVEFTTDDEMTSGPITMAIKNGNIYMKTKFEGMDATMLYQKKKDSVYVILSDYHVYCKMPSSVMDDLDMSDFGDASEVKSIEVSDVNLGDRECRCETFTLEDGSVSSYYFYNGELVRLDQISSSGETSIMSITKISSSVDDSLFELPKGYIPVNLSKLPFDDETTNGD